MDEFPMRIAHANTSDFHARERCFLSLALDLEIGLWVSKTTITSTPNIWQTYKSEDDDVNDDGRSGRSDKQFPTHAHTKTLKLRAHSKHTHTHPEFLSDL